MFVDEFQDANPAQFRLVRAWLGDRTDLCVVGDGDQAIYGFAGADASYLTAFGDHFRGAAVVRLGTNYRSSPQVVSAAASVLTTSGERAAIRSSRPEGPLPVVRAYPSDEAEAEGVARALHREHPPGTRWSSAAVLYRTNAQSALFEEALRREGVPFRVRGGGRFLDRPEVQVALDTLRERTREQPGVPFAGQLEALTDSAADASEERREHVETIGRLGRDYLAADGGNGSLAGFLEFLQTALRAGDDTGASSGDAVELLSFHRAKGLEFDTVFVVGLETGLVPIVHAETPSEKAEELRLLYVALSRAERNLQVSWAQKRTMGMRTYRRTPSPWLKPIEATVAAAGTPERGAAARNEQGRGLAAAREHVAGRPPPVGSHARSARRHCHRAPRRAPRMAPQPRPRVRRAGVRDLPRHDSRGRRPRPAALPRRPADDPGYRAGQAPAARPGPARAGRPAPRLSAAKAAALPTAGARARARESDQRAR